MKPENAVVRKTKQSRSEVKHEEIVDAAFQCILEAGYAKTTMDMVAAKAGCTRGGVVYHFGSNKSALVMSVAAMLSSRLLDVDLADATEGKNRLETLAIALQRAARIYSGDEALVLLDIWVGCRSDDGMRRQLAKMVADLNDKVLSHWLAKVGLARLDPAEVAYRILFRAALRGLMVERILHGVDPTHEDALELLFGLGAQTFSKGELI